MSSTEGVREGSLQMPQRHPVPWHEPDFYDEQSLLAEMERQFHICHGCRRCVNLCHAFPTLFDLVDNSDTLEVDGVAKSDYWGVVDHCYLCDLCFMTKCPYVPPHEWNMDFPHLMLRAKAFRFQRGETRIRDRLLTSTDMVGRLAGIPVVAQTVNALNRNRPARKLLEKTLGVDAEAPLPRYQPHPFRRDAVHRPVLEAAPEPAGPTRGRVALYVTCYGNYNEPGLAQDLMAVFEHNEIPVRVVERERCCGMPKLELGDLAAVERLKEANIPVLARLVDEGWDLVAPMPSCVLMYKQELPLLFPDDPEVHKVRAAIFDPFEYLVLRHRHGKLKTDFRNPLGSIVYHAACHVRVQNVGLKTREVLSLVPDTRIEVVERCSGHDGTYAVKRETRAMAVKIGLPVVKRVQQAAPDHYSSDCALAGHHIGDGLGNGRAPEHPLRLLRLAYGI
ncbi:MAG: Fe-S oxidoreductase [Chromatiales bacterium 21-64-14]|nr:MAG: Fe-S oxidoreductase [Chromatiales bacterium 21-64-14]HQU15559.1 heterodisulfide reductase-related iron-sulfur binding cluster [Gammaproteobacteria bacterium]